MPGYHGAAGPKAVEHYLLADVEPAWWSEVIMKRNRWVVVANVGSSPAAKRTDSSGDMEQLEMMEFLLVSEHDTKNSADLAAEVKRASNDGWRYAVISRRAYDASLASVHPRAA